MELKENNKTGIGAKTYKMKLEMDKKAAEEEKQEEIENEADRITLDEAAKRYLAIIYKSRTAKRTYDTVEDYYKHWIQEQLVNKKLNEISVNDIQSVVSNIPEKRASRTANYIKVIIRQLFNFAKDNDLYFKDNPTSKLKIKLSDNKRQRFLTKEEARKLLDRY